MTLAQRMIVMNAGRMEQIGTPEEVYLRPASTFVAGFIGSPPMNLLHGQAAGNTFTSGGQMLSLPARAPRDGDLILGLRPEHAEVRSAGAEGWPFKVEMIEMLGAERLIYGRIGDSLFTARVDGTRVPPQVGDILTLHSDAGQLHWFDATSLQRV
jgi:sn-glycerol 3-phosphate transport system ATP-binding protein